MEDYRNFVGENERILEEWRMKFPKQKQDKFAKDGIMNKGEFDENNAEGIVWRNSGNENEMWAEAPLRVLFLTKDENISSTEKVWDIRRETFHQKGIDAKQNIISDSTFYRNEANILYGLLNTTKDNLIGFHEFSHLDALRFSDDVVFARINCKKEGGKETIDNNELKSAIDLYYEDLKKQVCVLEADIFVCCGHQQEKNIILDTLYKIYPNEFKYVSLGIGKGTGLHYNERGNKLAIDAYHLSYLTGGEELRYYEVVGAYYEFLKQHPEFVNSHRK